MSDHRENALRRAAARISGRDTRDRVSALERLLKKLGDAHREQATATQSRIGELAQEVAQQPTAKDLHELTRAVRDLGRRVDHGAERYLLHAGEAGRQQLEEKRLEKTLEHIAAGTAPVIVGPWTGEVGFELLYWIPFLNWVRAHSRIDPERLVVVSRGGVASWYGVPESQYVDAFSVFTPAQFREAASEEASKQRRLQAFDEQILEAVRSRRGVTAPDLLHPSLMYRMLMPYWRDEAGYARVASFTAPARLATPHEPGAPALPPDFVAVRFYFSEAFPDTPANRAFAREVVTGLAERVPVVVLSPRLEIDDHADWSSEAGDRILVVGDSGAPDRNLALQTHVISRARAFVGTYGGYSYLAPFHGVPSLAFYSAPTFKYQHLQAAQRAFAQLGGATVTAMSVDAATVAADVVSGLARAPHAPGFSGTLS